MLSLNAASFWLYSIRGAGAGLAVVNGVCLSWRWMECRDANGIAGAGFPVTMRDDVV